MSDESNGSKITLSRRKALAGIGTIGTASALGLGGTYAQFTDTEENTATFTAGGIDGTISWTGSYSGNEVDDALEHVDTSGEGVEGSVHFSDVKPGDYGSVNFAIEVENNPAWVASCLDYSNNDDYKIFEPEAEADDDLNESDINVDGDGELDGEPAESTGELAQNLLTIPFYDSDDTSRFFDSEGAKKSFGEDSDFATPIDFWSNSEDKSGPDDYLAPRTVANVARSAGSLNTIVWNGEESYTCEAPDGASVADGCVFLDGSLAGEEHPDSTDNTRKVSPLQPGDTLYFGYDFHLPFETGNKVQGDRLDIHFGFNFMQVRHTEAPEFGNYSPGSNTPNGSDS